MQHSTITLTLPLLHPYFANFTVEMMNVDDERDVVVEEDVIAVVSLLPSVMVLLSLLSSLFAVVKIAVTESPVSNLKRLL